MFGSLNEAQKNALRPFVRGRVVTDLGAGDGGWARYLVGLGAVRVVAVDKERVGCEPHPRIEIVTSYFRDYNRPVDVAFVSWPSNSTTLVGLVKVLSRSETVIYLGSNTDGCACGTKEFFGHLLGRKLCAYVPDRRNTLIVCGGTADKPRQPQGEEWAGMFDRVQHTFEQAERTAARMAQVSLTSGP